MNKYLSRITSSARGETFNFLIWPFLLATGAYGVGFALIMPYTDDAGHSTLYDSMEAIYPHAPQLWGIIALLNIIGGLVFLLLDITPFGRASGLVGFTLWCFAAWCYMLTDDWVTLFSIAIPNAMFWIWQYLSLSLFRRENAEDVITLRDNMPS
jgi:hypothetical protein